MAPAKARRILDRYVLEQPIGRGGMGVVWKAEDTLLARSVAIKEVQLPPVLPAEQEQLRRRVMREARAAARLSHHGVVTLYDVVRDQNRTYIVMELVEARTLADIVRQQGPLSPRQAADVGRRVLDALQAAHRRGIVHRDVKPGNVMVLADGRTKLADFGIASLSGDPELTATGTVLGSPSYMAPEQANGEASGPASDLYALGATLYFAVEGEPPFSKGAALPTLTAVVHEQARPMRQAGPLAPVIAALLAKSPEDRPAGNELIEMLDAVAEERGTFGQQLSASLSRPPWRRGRRRPWPRPDIEADAGVTAIQPTDDLPSVDAPTAAEAPPAPTARIDTPAKEAARSAKERAPEAPPAPAEDDPPTPAAEAPTKPPTKPPTTPATTAPQRRTRKVTSKRQPARPATSTPATSTKAAPAKPAAAGTVAEGTGAESTVAEGAGTPAAAQAATQAPATGVTEPASKPPPAPPEPKPEPLPEPKPEPRPAPTAKTPDTKTPDTKTPDTRTPDTKAPAEPGTSSAGAWSRRRVAVLVGVALVVAVLVGGWLALENRGGSPEGLAATDTTSQTVAGGATGTTAAPTTTAATTAPTTAPPTSAVAGAAPPPAGWETFRNEQAGYVAAHPAGWKVVRRQGRAIDLVKPNSGTYLRVDWTPTPGPSALGAWRDYEPGFASGKRGYKRIRMEKTDYRGLDAAIWEYTYTEGNTRLHAVNLGFVASDQRAYALNFQTRETDWAAEQPTFESVKRSFAFGT